MKTQHVPSNVIPLFDFDQVVNSTDKLQVLVAHNASLVKIAQDQIRQHRQLVDASRFLLDTAVPMTAGAGLPPQLWSIPGTARNNLLAALFTLDVSVGAV